MTGINYFKVPEICSLQASTYVLVLWLAANHDLGRKSLISTKLQQIRHFVKRTVPPFGISLKINLKKKTRLNKPLADIYCDKCPEFS